MSGRRWQSVMNLVHASLNKKKVVIHVQPLFSRKGNKGTNKVKSAKEEMKNSFSAAIETGSVKMT
jgi:hypothetical protein